MLTGVMLLFTLVLYVFFLDEDTDLPLYWITTSFFVTTILFAVTLILIYQSKCYSRAHGGMTSKVYIFVAILAFAQGLFLWLYNSQWGRLMDVAAWIIALPTFIFLGASFYRTLMQTYQKRNDVGPHMVRQFAFLFLILMTAYVVLAVVIYTDDPDVAWVQPKWIVLPFMIYTVLLMISAIYVYWATRGSQTAMEKKMDVQLTTVTTTSYAPISQTPAQIYGLTLTYLDQHKESYTSVPLDQTRSKELEQFLPGYNPSFGYDQQLPVWK
jgi:phosphatidylglycerophosphate synthase